jgi:hypothetical protein
MAFVFMGKGHSRAAGRRRTAHHRAAWLATRGNDGNFPERETLLGQALLLLLFAFALLKTFWPSRSVSLPTVPTNGDTMTRVLERLEAIEKRLDSGSR